VELEKLENEALRMERAAWRGVDGAGETVAGLSV